MLQLKKLLWISVALFSASIGWLSLDYAIVADRFSPGMTVMFMITGLYFLLIALFLAVNTLVRPMISSSKLYLLLAFSGFIATLPLAVVFGFTGDAVLVVACAFILAWLPLAAYLETSIE